MCLFGNVVTHSAHLARISPPHTVLSDDSTASMLTHLNRELFVESSASSVAAAAAAVTSVPTSLSASSLVAALLPSSSSSAGGSSSGSSGGGSGTGSNVVVAAASPAASLQSALAAAANVTTAQSDSSAALMPNFVGGSGRAWRLTRPRAGDKPERPLAASAERIDEVVAEAMSSALNVLMNETSLYVASGEGRVILVEGKPGLGKNMLRRCYMQRVQKSSFASLLICESGVDALPPTPFSVWAPIFEQLVAHAIEPLRLPLAFDELCEQLPLLQDFCAEDEDVLALLNDVLPFAFPINSRLHTRSAQTSARQHDSALLHSAARLLAMLLVDLLEDLPKLIVLGSAVHIDHISWRVIKELQHSQVH